MAFMSDIRQLAKRYYIFNIILSLSYILFKKTPGICQYFFGEEGCEFHGRETEILFFLIIVIMIRTRKAGSYTMIQYLSSSFLYTKVANLILWFMADFLMGILYTIIFIFGALLFPEPPYSDPDNITYFLGEQALEEELKNFHGTWVVAFYTAWSPACINLAPTFAHLSMKYTLPKLRFGKIDIGRYPNAAKKYNINDSSFSKQLPTIIMFQNGQQLLREPTIDRKGRVSDCKFSIEYLIMRFELDDLYEEYTKKAKTAKAKPIKGD